MLSINAESEPRSRRGPDVSGSTIPEVGGGVHEQRNAEALGHRRGLYARRRSRREHQRSFRRPKQKAEGLGNRRSAHHGGSTQLEHALFASGQTQRWSAVGDVEGHAVRAHYGAG